MKIEKVLLHYKGGRTQATPSYNRKKYVFNKSNDYIAEVPMDLAKQLLLTGEYIPVNKIISISHGSSCWELIKS